MTQWLAVEGVYTLPPYGGILHDKTQVVALFRGVCEVNAAIAAQIMIDKYEVDLVIASGTAGRLEDGFKLATRSLPTRYPITMWLKVY